MDVALLTISILFVAGCLSAHLRMVRQLRSARDAALAEAADLARQLTTAYRDGYTRGHSDATDDVNARRDHELAVATAKARTVGQDEGYNAALDQLDQWEYTDPTTTADIIVTVSA